MVQQKVQKFLRSAAFPDAIDVDDNFCAAVTSELLSDGSQTCAVDAIDVDGDALMAAPSGSASTCAPVTCFDESTDACASADQRGNEVATTDAQPLFTP